MSTWDWIIAEFKALGLYCVAHGPEFWLAVAGIGGVAALSVAVGYFIWREDDDDRR